MSDKSDKSDGFPAVIVPYACPRTPRKSRQKLAEAEGGGLLLAELAELAEM